MILDRSFSMWNFSSSNKCIERNVARKIELYICTWFGRIALAIALINGGHSVALKLTGKRAEGKFVRTTNAFLASNSGASEPWDRINVVVDLGRPTGTFTLYATTLSYTAQRYHAGDAVPILFWNNALSFAKVDEFWPLWGSSSCWLLLSVPLLWRRRLLMRQRTRVSS